MEIDTTYMCWLCAGCCSVDVLAVTDVVPVWLCFVSDHGACIHPFLKNIICEILYMI